jgi:hypothetical protein
VDDTPEPGEMLQPNVPFDAAELWAAYRAGAKSARAHHPVTDELIDRAADAYVKCAHLNRPRFDWSAMPMRGPVKRVPSEKQWEELRARIIEAVRTIGSARSKEIVEHLHERYDRVSIALSACVNTGRLVRHRPPGTLGYVYAIPPDATDDAAGSVVLAVDPSRSTPNPERR